MQLRVWKQETLEFQLPFRWPYLAGLHICHSAFELQGAHGVHIAAPFEECLDHLQGLGQRNLQALSHAGASQADCPTTGSSVEPRRRTHQATASLAPAIAPLPATGSSR